MKGKELIRMPMLNNTISHLQFRFIEKSFIAELQTTKIPLDEKKKKNTFLCLDTEDLRLATHTHKQYLQAHNQLKFGIRI